MEKLISLASSPISQCLLCGSPGEFSSNINIEVIFSTVFPKYSVFLRTYEAFLFILFLLFKSTWMLASLCWGKRGYSLAYWRLFSECRGQETNFRRREFYHWTTNACNKFWNQSWVRYACPNESYLLRHNFYFRDKKLPSLFPLISKSLHLRGCRVTGSQVPHTYLKGKCEIILRL